MDEGIVRLLGNDSLQSSLSTMERIFKILNGILASDSLKRWDGEKHVGKVGLVGLEVICIGIARNLDAIQQRSDITRFLQDRIRGFWSQDEVNAFISPGLRGTSRIQRTVPFGESWFRR